MDLAPLVAGAGIVGIALGFGAQSLVKDFLSGLFIILEAGQSVLVNAGILDTATPPPPPEDAKR